MPRGYFDLYSGNSYVILQGPFDSFNSSDSNLSIRSGSGASCSKGNVCISPKKLYFLKFFKEWFYSLGPVRAKSKLGILI